MYTTRESPAVTRMPLIRSGSPVSARLKVAACPAAVASKTGLRGPVVKVPG